MVELFATCARGLEDVSAAEVAELIAAGATADVDKVTFAARWREVCALQVRARTLHKVHLLLARAEVKGLDDVAAVARGVDWAAHLGPAQAFAVRGVRSGTHDFTSVDVGRVVGKEVQQGVRRSTGRLPPVDLDAPEVEVSALVRDHEVLLGLNLTGESLHHRGYRVWQHVAPLRPTLAAALLAWGGYDASKALWDPMCGSGTIPIEAALRGRARNPNAARPFLMERLRGFPAEALAEARASAMGEGADAPLRLLGTDHSPQSLRGAAENARAAGVGDAVQLRMLDATEATPSDLPWAPDLVVLNPPYGLRVGSFRVVARLYRRFLERAAALAPGQLVVLVGNPVFERVAREQGLAPEEARDVLYGDLRARALRFRFRKEDAVSDHAANETVK